MIFLMCGLSILFEHLGGSQIIFKQQMLLPGLKISILDLSAKFFGFRDALCLLKFSNKPLRPSQNSCIHAKMKQHW